MKRRIAASICVMLAVAASAAAAGRGVEIRPDANGKFEYADDFETAKFLDDAFLDNMGVACWQKGSIWSSGPNRNRTLTYRFFGDRVITGLEVRIDQSANGPNLGGRNTLLLSANGLDWQAVASSADLDGDRNGWQSGPVAVPAEAAGEFCGRPEVWVRVVMDNCCGLPTRQSNAVKDLNVTITMGDRAAAGADPQTAQRQAWGRLRGAAGWRSITLHWADPVDRRAPHYYEDSDGWLEAPGANPNLAPDETQGFPIRRTRVEGARSPLSLAVFVETDRADGPLMARITARCTRTSPRKLPILWDGEPLATFDTAGYFDAERPLFVEMPSPLEAGVHELRVAGADAGVILVREIALAGDGSPRWAAKPVLPAGGSLDALGAYYLPDPEPPAASQAVEGRQAAQEVGLIIKGIQRLYEEHMDFGGLRLAVRNNSAVPVRIARPIRLNGKPIREHYVDFKTGPWDARGVVWHRVRPRLLEPGACGQIYVRFRRRPAGDTCVLAVPLENGDPLEVTVPYRDPGLQVDYVTTGEAMEDLYVYVRRSAGAEPGKVTGLSFDGAAVRGAKIYGADFPGNVALVVARLPKKAEPLTYHVVGVQTDRGSSVAAQFRVLPFTFPRSSIHVPGRLCGEMHMNLGMWRWRSLEECLKYDIHSTSYKVFDQHERIAFILGPDEPDAKDNRAGGGHANGLGWHARRLAHSGWQELIEHHAPHAASWIVMNGTVRPLNWSVYGQIADVSCFDPYPINFYAGDHAYVRESLQLARRCGAPNRMFACMEAFGWKKGQGVPAGARGPSPAEYRQNIVQAIGSGMKGLTSWVHSAGAGGWQVNEPCAKEIAKLNALIEHIEDHLLLGTPIDIAASDAGQVMTGVVSSDGVANETWPKERVWVGALLCGPDAIVLAAANHIPASKPEPPVIEPAKDVTITVRLPEYLRSVQAFEATESGVAPFECTVEDGRALLKLDQIPCGRVFLLRRK